MRGSLGVIMGMQDGGIEWMCSVASHLLEQRVPPYRGDWRDGNGNNNNN